MDTYTDRSIRCGVPSAMPNLLHGRLCLRFILLAIFTAILLCGSVQAAQVTLAWDANNPAPDGYRVFQRVEGETYDYSSPVWPRPGDDATRTTCTIENLADDTTYYFIARAYVGSDESGDSNEASYHTGSPNVTNPPPANTFTITATAGVNGSITPGTVPVNAGDSQSFTIAPEDGHHVADVLVDGQSVGARTSYHFSDVDRDHTITASFAPDPLPAPETYTITSTSGENGTITPGTATVNAGDDQTFTIVPETHFQVADVLVDGQSVGARTSYTFNDVDRDHTISASFIRDPITITASAGDNGSIDPSGTVNVDYGGSQTFSIAADEGYEIDQIVVDGVSRSITDRYTFDDVTASHSISVSFSRTANEPPVADAGPDQTVDEAREVTLSGHNSHDNDDGIMACQWIQISGPSVDLAATAEDDVVTFIAPDVDKDGIALEFEFSVTDASGETDKDRCLVNVTWVNETPTADAGDDLSAKSGETVRLSGEASSDRDDGIASYEWEQLEGPIVELDSYSTASPSFAAPDGGAQGVSLVFELTVTDVGGLQDTDSCTVNVASENQAPVADAGPDQRAVPGSEVTMDGSGSTDPEGTPLEFQWRQTDGFPMALSDAQAVTPVFTVPENADDLEPAAASSSGNKLVFELTVTDGGGLSSVDTCEVVVDIPSQTGDEEPPEIKIERPSRALIMTRRSKLTISGKASDNERVDRVVWSDDQGNSGEAVGTDQWRIEDLSLQPWINTITITAYDSAGNASSQKLIVYAIFRYYSLSKYR